MGYVTKILLGLQTEVDQDSQMPLDKLTAVSKSWVEKNGGCTVNTIQDVVKEIDEKQNKKVSISYQLLVGTLSDWVIVFVLSYLGRERTRVQFPETRTTTEHSSFYPT